jgi:hypothetical protein
MILAPASNALGIDFHQHQLQASSTFPWTTCTRCPCSRATIVACSWKIRLSSRPTLARRKWRARFAKRLNATLAIIDKAAAATKRL